MILAECSDAEIGRITRHLNATREEGAPEKLEEIRTIVEKSRYDGFACVIGRLLPGMGSLSVPLPVRDSFGKPLILSISGTESELSNDPYALALSLFEEIGRLLPAQAATTADNDP